MISLSGHTGPGSFRSSQRLTITVAHTTLDRLVERSNSEGRSLSNLAAYLLESSLVQRGGDSPAADRRPAAP